MSVPRLLTALTVLVAAAALATALAASSDAATVRTGSYAGEASGADGGGNISIRVGRESRRPQLTRLAGVIRWECGGDRFTTKLPGQILKRGVITRDGRLRYLPVNFELRGELRLQSFRGTLVMKSPYCESRPLTVQLTRRR